MRTVKLTVLIDDEADLDMQVHVVAAEHPAVTMAAPVQVTPLRPRAVPCARNDEDEYTLGGYAGI